jgi:futalosine hydrolase
MHLLLASATILEIHETADRLKHAHKSNNAWEPELLITGPGQLQTAWALQKNIQTRRPDLVIQAGIGGGASIGDLEKTFAIVSDKIADLGALNGAVFESIFDLRLADPDQFPFQKGRLVNPYKALLDWTGLPKTGGITVNEIKSEFSEGFQRMDGSVVESMEGAALHYVCLMEKIPFLQIRSVSNRLGERDKTKWKLKEAIAALNETLDSLIQKLEHADKTILGI